MAYRRTAAIQARLDDQRAALLSAAAELLAEGGYASCGVAAVAKRAGVATGTVYQHFPAKAELVAELFDAVVRREVAAVRGAVDAASTAEDRVVAVVETFAGRALKAPRRAYALLAEPVDPGVAALRLEFRRAFRDVLAAAIAQGVTDGELPAQDAQVVAAALVGAIGGALIGPLAGADTAPSATIEALVRFARRSVGGARHGDA